MVELAIKDAGKTPREIGPIVFFEEIFGRSAEMGFEPKKCVPCGAAIQAGVLSGEVGRSSSWTSSLDYRGRDPGMDDHLPYFNLDGIPLAPCGAPKIEVAFDIEAGVILNVSVKDLETERSQSIRITDSTRLSEREKDV